MKDTTYKAQLKDFQGLQRESKEGENQSLEVLTKPRKGRTKSNTIEAIPEGSFEVQLPRAKLIKGPKLS